MRITWGLVYHKGTCHKDTCNMVTKFWVWTLDNSIMLDKLLSRRQIFVCAFHPIDDKNKCTRPVSGIPFIRYVSGTPFIRYVSRIPFIRYVSGIPFIRYVSGIPFIWYVSGLPFIWYVSGIPFIRYAQNRKIGSKII